MTAVIPFKRNPNAPATADELDAYLQALAEGRRGSEIHSDPLMPTRWQVARAMRELVGFSERVADASVVGLMAMEEEILDIADDSSEDFVTDSEGRERFNAEAVQRSKLKIDTRFKLLENLRRERFGKEKDKSDGMDYVVELPAPQSKEQWLAQNNQAQQPSIAGLSTGSSQDRNTP